ncbi:DUF4184 family protein [Chengkuizengella axinellae]|uniref:DUF4184 family protein n=1 Tax=Chengkuizengella axinellae TaxID=3064388 RepID=A0ABT9J2N4_9BACL|nr:DUF4184 family protein [Chengkuizengella sp. 2205SS18-9]MDP5275874.1 DUF4184 family protein [Chengkuizengella sp. 2205SS18-9]
MPFTFAHPLYAIPLKWIKPKYFCITGLVLGSMSPDFEYFLALEPHQTLGHSLLGLFFQAIPLSILFALLFHKIMIRSLSLHLPSLFDVDLRFYHLLHTWQLNTFRQWWVFLTSVIIGFFSHIFIDAFTHAGGYFVLKLPFLTTTIFSIPIYKWLQHSLSLFGLIFLAFILIQVLRKKNNIHRKIVIRKHQKLKYWGIVILTAMIVTILKLLFTSSTNLIGILVVSPISGTMLGILIASLFYRE